MSSTVFGDSEEDKNERWFTAHSLRYTYATTLWRNGLDLYIISKLLEHSTIQTTENYPKVGETEINERYEKWAAEMSV